jgi:hypothetical protein
LREHSGDVASDVCDRLVGETGGNPLALVELAASLTSGQLAGREPLPRPLRLPGRVEEAFLGRVRLLPRTGPSRPALHAQQAADIIFG